MSFSSSRSGLGSRRVRRLARRRCGFARMAGRFRRGRLRPGSPGHHGRRRGLGSCRSRACLLQSSTWHLPRWSSTQHHVGLRELPIWDYPDDGQHDAARQSDSSRPGPRAGRLFAACAATLLGTSESLSNCVGLASPKAHGWVPEGFVYAQSVEEDEQFAYAGGVGDLGPIAGRDEQLPNGPVERVRRVQAGG